MLLVLSYDYWLKNVHAGLSMEELVNIPAGRRRKYHDDVTVIVIILGMNQRTSKASTCI